LLFFFTIAWRFTINSRIERRSWKCCPNLALCLCWCWNDRCCRFFVYCDIISLIVHIIISARKRIIPHYNLRQAVSLVLGKIVCFVL